MDNNFCPISKKLRIVFLKKNTPIFKTFYFITINANKIKIPFFTLVVYLSPHNKIFLL